MNELFKGKILSFHSLKHFHLQIGALQGFNSTLIKWMCGKLNWQGTQCKGCISGYGPLTFSDGISCADCSHYRYTWTLNFLLQLLHVCHHYVYSHYATENQRVFLSLEHHYHLKSAGSKCDHVWFPSMLCFIGEKVTIAILTILGITDLEFFSCGHSTIVCKYFNEGNWHSCLIKLAYIMPIQK